MGRPRKQPDPPAPLSLTWSAPPEPIMTGKSSMYEPLLIELKANEGRWAQMRLFETSSAAHNARHGLKRITAKDERWEFVSRKTGEGDQAGLWGRYRSRAQMQEGT
jgi:hypothetical protein